MLLVILAWLSIIAAAWLKILTGIDVFALPRWCFLTVFSVLSLGNGIYMKRHFDYYRKHFDDWSVEERNSWDVVLVIFIVCAFAFSLYSASAARDSVVLSSQASGDKF